MILHDFARLESRAAVDIYTAVYNEALMVENPLRAAGAFTPRGDDDGSRRGNDDSRRGKPFPHGPLKGQLLSPTC